MQAIKLPSNSVVWEPTCAEGQMARVIERHCPQVICSDLRGDDEIYGIPSVDFIAHPAPGLPVDWIITNPPFKVAEAFIRKSLSIAPNVAMLLKSQYWHAATRLGLFNDHPPSEIMPLTWRPAFLERERGSNPLMDVIWSVWRAGSGETRYHPLPRPKNVAPLSDLHMDLFGPPAEVISRSQPYITPKALICDVTC